MASTVSVRLPDKEYVSGDFDESRKVLTLTDSRAKALQPNEELYIDGARWVVHSVHALVTDDEEERLIQADVRLR